VLDELQALSARCADYDERHRLKRAPNYVQLFLDNGSDHEIALIAEKIEHLTEELSNCKDSPMFGWLDRYPFVSPNAHKAPFSRQWLNVLTGVILPVGLFFYFRIWMFRLRLDKDLQLIQQIDREVEKRIREHILIGNEQ
jgi:lipopolysaccharide export system permease protein